MPISSALNMGLELTLNRKGSTNISFRICKLSK